MRWYCQKVSNWENHIAEEWRSKYFTHYYNPCRGELIVLFLFPRKRRKGYLSDFRWIKPFIIYFLRSRRTSWTLCRWRWAPVSSLSRGSRRSSWCRRHSSPWARSAAWAACSRPPPSQHSWTIWKKVRLRFYVERTQLQLLTLFSEPLILMRTRYVTTIFKLYSLVE